MYILSITYPNSDGATFDFDYFHQKHLPEVGKTFGPFGLVFASVLKGEQSVDGSAPAYFATTILSFAQELGARDAIESEGGKAHASDIKNFTTVKPIIQFNTPVQ
jgi:uncharacterized protein (TIGR02118 family)